MKNKRKYALGLLLGLCLLSPGCKDDFLALKNPRGFTNAQFYQTKDDAIQASTAMYGILQKQGLYQWQLPVTNDIRSDEYGGTLKIVGVPDMFRIETFTATASNEYVLEHWTQLYAGIFRTNQVLEGVGAMQLPDADWPALQQRILGEARFLRALHYFNLVLLFGDVPLVTTVAKSPAEYQLPRSPVSTIYEQVIIPDLRAAVEQLPSVTSYRGTNNLGRASKGTAQGLLGKVYLFLGRYAEAKAELKAVVESGAYDLVPRYRDNHDESNENNLESLFEVQFTRGGNGWDTDGENGIGEGSLYPVWGGHPSAGNFYNWMLTEVLVEAFEPEDTMRKNATAYYPGGPLWDPTGAREPWEVLNAQGNRVHPEGTFAMRKFCYDGKEGDNVGSGINYRILRFADVLLMYAEALNETDGPAAALPFINRVRLRAKVLPYPTAAFPATTRQDVFNILMHERMVELGGEGHRWNDLVRWDNLGKIDMTPYIKNPRLPNSKEAFDKSKHKLLPIPQKELDVNPKLVANSYR